MTTSYEPALSRTQGQQSQLIGNRPKQILSRMPPSPWCHRHSSSVPLLWARRSTLAESFVAQDGVYLGHRVRA